MTLPVWMLVVAAVGAVLGSGGLGVVAAKLIEGRNALPVHLNAELLRLAAERENDRLRMNDIETYLVRLGDHVDVLEGHIYKQLPPPPPPRPVYRPTHRSDTP